MYIEIEKADLEKKRVVSKKDGVIWFMGQQDALMFLDGSRYPEHIILNSYFSDNQQDADIAKPLPVGDYELSDNAFKVGQFKKVLCNIETKNLIRKVS